MHQRRTNERHNKSGTTARAEKVQHQIAQKHTTKTTAKIKLKNSVFNLLQRKYTHCNKQGISCFSLSTKQGSKTKKRKTMPSMESRQYTTKGEARWQRAPSDPSLLV